jgi:outer membrane receptor protein involved in Fe transport
MTRFRASLFCLLILSFVSPALAQEQSGSIQGVVRDAQGGVLPGATVEARSTNNAGVKTAVTDTTGTFRFPALAPGSYEFTASLTGFSPAKAQATVTLGQALKVDLSLKIGGMTDTIQVTGEAPLIDTKANASTATISEKMIETMPKGRGLISLLTQIPGTNNENAGTAGSRAGGLMIDGATGSENRYLIDGVDRTNARTGTASAISGTEIIAQDFVETVQVKQSGYNAEYQAALGGVVSVITKSGTNNFHGSAGGYVTNFQWSGSPRASLRALPSDASRSEYITIPKDKNFNTNYQVDPVFTLGGPIMKDKAWFFVGYGPQYWRQERTVTWRTPGTFAPTQTFDIGDPYQRALNYNIRTQVTSKLSLRATGYNERLRGGLGLPGIEPDGSSTSNAATFNPRSTIRSDAKSDGYSAIADFTASNSLFWNVTASTFKSDTFSAGGDYNHGIRRTFTTTNVGLAGVPANLQQISGFADGAANTFNAQDQYTRSKISSDLTWFKRAKGDHAIKFGFLYERIGNVANLGQQNTNIALNWNGTYATLSGGSARGTYGYFTASRSYTGGDIKETNLSFFAQDQWTVNNKLTLNYGLRVEREVIPSYKPENPGIEFGWGDKIAPRLGFAYDIKGDGKLKAFGSFGTFYDNMKLELPRGAWGGDHWIDYVYTLDSPNWPAITCTDPNGGRTCTGGTFIEQNDRRHVSNNPSSNETDPNMKPSQKREFTLGLERELSSTISLGFRYAHKWWVETIDDIGVQVPGVGEVFFVGNPGVGIGRQRFGAGFPEVPRVKNKYDGVEVVLRKRYSNNWQGTASILYSRQWGNYNGLASGEVPDGSGNRTSPNVGRYYDGLYMNYDEKGNEVLGLLPTDRPIQVKAQGSYSFKFGTSVGLNLFGMSGLPYTSYVTYQSVPVYFKGRNDQGRVPFLTQADLNVLHDIKIKGQAKLQLQLTVLNLLDQDTVTSLAGAAYRDALVIPGFATPQAAFFQSGGFSTTAIQAARLPASGRPQPTYNLANGYQSARGVRVAAKFTF